jgi:phage baseplate assembly protein W
MELYIKTIGDPNFDADQIQTDEDIQLLLTQIETLIFTNKGEVMGNPDFGLNIEDYVYSFRYNDTMLQSMIQEGISRYVPLSYKYPVSVNVEFTPATEKNMVFIDITIDGRYGIGLYV